jgi:hypothetical protein
MNKQRDKEQEPQIFMDVTPIRFGQPPQMPVGPIGNPPSGYYKIMQDRTIRINASGALTV